MTTIRCPRCLYHEQSYKTPLGKIVRNPHADLTKAVHDDCIACDGSGYIPELILDAVRSAFPKSADEIIPTIRWSMDHWSFILGGGLYVGIERDGYVHS
jgi:hypothetical protein